MATAKNHRGAKGNGSVFRTKDGRWVAKYSATTPNGLSRTYRLYGKTHEEVRRKLADAISKRDKGMVSFCASPTLGQFYHIWLEEIADNYLKPTTISTYSRIMEKLVLPIIGNKRLSNISVADIQRCVNLTKNSSVRQSQQVKVVMSSILSQAIKRQLLFYNPAREVETPRSQSSEPEMWNKDQLKRFLEKVKEYNSPYYLAYVLLATLGLRRGETLGVRWKDIDFDKGCLHICQQVLAIDNQPTISSLKTNSSNRILPLTPQVLDMFKEQFLRLKPSNLANLVFCTKNNTPISPRNFYRDFQKQIKNANLPRIKMHTLRHMAACFMRDAGVDMKTCQTMMGHSDISTTVKIYQHSDMTHKVEASRKLGDMLLA